MSFESKISDYIESYPKPDRRQITLATNNGEDSFVFVIEVFNNGKSTIDVRSRNREPISYYGIMRTNPPAQKKISDPVRDFLVSVCGVLEHLSQVLVLDKLTHVTHIAEHEANIFLIGLVGGMLKLSNPVATKQDRGKVTLDII